MAKRMASILTSLGTLTASPIAFLIVIAYGALWLLFEPERFDWHGAATLATWLMTLVIQRSEHRDTQAIHAKLDNLLRVTDRADTGLSTIDEKEPEHVEEFRDNQKRDL